MEQTFSAEEIDVGFHPDGYRTDKTASPMNWYTKWKMLPGNKWCGPEPVCFDVLPGKAGLQKTDSIGINPIILRSMLDMKIAIASGKGGTGKTTIATNHVCSIARMGKEVQYLDCDVEEPNGHIFLKPDIRETHNATIGVPEVNTELCEGCGNCGQLCQYSAIVCLKEIQLVFEQLCHSCGGCMLVCPTDAVTEMQIPTGFVESSNADGVKFAQGRVNIGDVRSPALIKKVKEKILNDGLAIIDTPPGTSCPVPDCISCSGCIA